ncbi:MAG: radical SAM family heme chaperone HemW, partial [Arenicella sp.]
MSDLIPLSLYIHVPWCERKCPYCDFNSHENKEQFNESAYISALLDDLEQELHYAQSRPLQSIFIGGGTPSLFSADSYQRLLKGIEQKLPFAKDIEITLEANPGSSEREKFQGYRTAGVNRLSIGIQSFDADKLKKIGRIHNQQDALQAAIAANDAGFDNFNLDLMYALPQQTLEQAISDVQTAISLQPSHLSCYQLTLEPNTTFYRQPPQLPNSDQAWAMQKQLQKELAQAGFMQYEVSAYAHQKRYCR